MAPKVKPICLYVKINIQGQDHSYESAVILAGQRVSYDLYLQAFHTDILFIFMSEYWIFKRQYKNLL